MMQRITPSYYEFVKKKDYGPVKHRFEDEILPVAREVLREMGYTFQSELMGSGSRKLVTRVIDGNKGFDFDYDFELQYYPEDADAKRIKQDFMNALNKASKPLGYKPCEDSTTVITFKMVDTTHSRIIHSFDIALTYSDEDGKHYIRFDKDNRRYIWNLRKSGICLDDKISELRNELGSQYHQALADKYLQLKNANTNPDRKSFILYAEAVCYLYNEIILQPSQVWDDYDEDDDYYREGCCLCAFGHTGISAHL